MRMKKRKMKIGMSATLRMMMGTRMKKRMKKTKRTRTLMRKKNLSQPWIIPLCRVRLTDSDVLNGNLAFFSQDF